MHYHIGTKVKERKFKITWWQERQTLRAENREPGIENSYWDKGDPILISLPLYTISLPGTNSVSLIKLSSRHFPRFAVSKNTHSPVPRFFSLALWNVETSRRQNRLYRIMLPRSWGLDFQKESFNVLCLACRPWLTDLKSYFYVVLCLAGLRGNSGVLLLPEEAV